MVLGMEQKDVTVFVDESGTIAKGTVHGNSNFIITMLFVQNDDIEHVRKVFKKERLKVVNKKEELKVRLKDNKEIKGSELSETEKYQIYSKLQEKCGDKFEIVVIVMSNKKATVKFRSNSSRAFNYLIKTFLDKHFKKKSRYRCLNSIQFIIDERNVVTESKYTLQEYLNTELNLLEHFSEQDISVRYQDSKNYLLLQLADFISNTFYREQQKHIEEAKDNTTILLNQTSTGKVFKFPYYEKKREHNIIKCTTK